MVNWNLPVPLSDSNIHCSTPTPRRVQQQHQQQLQQQQLKQYRKKSYNRQKFHIYFFCTNTPTCLDRRFMILPYVLLTVINDWQNSEYLWLHVHLEGRMFKADSSVLWWFPNELAYWYKPALCFNCRLTTTNWLYIAFLLCSCMVILDLYSVSQRSFVK